MRGQLWQLILEGSDDARAKNRMRRRPRKLKAMEKKAC